MKLNKEGLFEVINESLVNMVEEIEVGPFTPLPLTISINGRFTFTDLDAFSWERMERLLLADTALEVDAPYNTDDYTPKKLTVKKFIKYFDKVTSEFLDGGQNDDYISVIVKVAFGMHYTELYLCADVYHILMAELKDLDEHLY